MSNQCLETSSTNSSVMLGFEAIRLLSQTAEACLRCVLEQGHDVDLVRFAMHCSDRAEHVAQYYREAPTEGWVLKCALDDLLWLTEFYDVIERVRLKVDSNVPSRDDLEKLLHSWDVV